MFSEWKTSDSPSSSLWIYGKRSFMSIFYAFVETEHFSLVAGAGKSVFWYVRRLGIFSRKLIALASSTIIENLDAMRNAGLASLGFFYCDFREDQKKELRGLLSSLLVQLYNQTDSYCDKISEFYLEHAKNSRRPSDDALAGCLKDLLKLPGLAPVYLVVDALDECPNTPTLRSPRAKVLNFIKELIGSQFSNLRLCVTSREEADIKNVLKPLNFRSVSLHDQSEQKRDIANYIISVLDTHSNDSGWKEEHKQRVIKVLTEKSDGM